MREEAIIKEFRFKFHGARQPNRTRLQTQNDLEQFIRDALAKYKAELLEELKEAGLLKNVRALNEVQKKLSELNEK